MWSSNSLQCCVASISIVLVLVLIKGLVQIARRTVVSTGPPVHHQNNLDGHLGAFLWEIVRFGRREQARKIPPGPELPGELWSTIAGILGQKEWARVSGTCKTFQRTQFPVLEVQSNRLEELLWLSKRWSTAQALVIQPSSLEATSASYDASTLERLSAAGAVWPQNLRHLSVYAPVDVNYPYTPTTPVPQWAQQVVSNAHKVEVLVLNCLQSVPVALISMAALKHLAITASGSAMPAEWDWIKSLCCLETLHIAITNHNLYNHEYLTPTAAIHLLACKNLRALHVRNLVPTDLAVPESCRVTFEGTLPTDAAGMSSRLMQGIMAILPVCSVFSIWLYDHKGSPSHLKILEKALKQSLLYLEELDIGCFNRSVDSAPFVLGVCDTMPRLTRLRIRSLETPIHVVVRSPVHLRTLILEDDSGMSASPVHAASIFGDIEQVELRWWKGQPNIIDSIAQLLLARVRQGTVEWGNVNEQEGQFKWLLSGGREVINWQPSSLDMILPGYSRHPYNCLSAMNCGACEECLEQDGLLYMYR